MKRKEFTKQVWNDMSKEDQKNYNGFEDFYMWYWNAI